MNYKRYLVPIVVAAVLVNFSLVLTKMTIDVSNVAAISFYDTAKTVAGGSPADYIEQSLDIDTRVATITSIIKSFESSIITDEMVAPKVFRMPISFVRCSAAKEASPKSPRQATNTARIDAMTAISARRSSLTYCALNSSSYMVYSKG